MVLGKERDQGVVDWGAAKIVFCFCFWCVCPRVREGGGMFVDT